MKLSANTKKIISFIIGITIFGIFVYFGGKNILHRLYQIRIQFLFLSLFFMLIQTFLTSSRWGVITNSIIDDKISYLDYYYYFLLASSAGYFIPYGISDISIKMISLKKINKVSLKRGFSSSVLDRFADIFVLMITLIPIFFYLMKYISIKSTILFMIILFITAGFLIFILKQKIIMLLLNLTNKILNFLTIKKWFLSKFIEDKIKSRTESPDFKSTLDKINLFKIYSISITKHLFIVLNFYCVFKAIGIDISILNVAIGISIAQLRLIIAFTPRGLGVTELGWFAALSILGFSRTSVIAFVITRRVFDILFFSIFTLIFHLLFSATKIGSKSQNESNNL